MTDAQARLWMLGTALKYSADNNTDGITPEVEAFVLDEFMGEASVVEDELVTEIVNELDTSVEEYL